MCGIIGLINITNSDEIVKEVSLTQRHRGPDAQDYWNNKRIYFSQLLGMSDHISYNAAKRGFNVAKYVPYGPVEDVLPYLIRRAEENTSISGQIGRELSNILAERKRRKKG